MTERDNYVTAENPSIDDWLGYNDNLFHHLRGEEIVGGEVTYTPLVDVDLRS